MLFSSLLPGRIDQQEDEHLRPCFVKYSPTCEEAFNGLLLCDELKHVNDVSLQDHIHQSRLTQIGNLR